MDKPLDTCPGCGKRHNQGALHSCVPPVAIVAKSQMAAWLKDLDENNASLEKQVGGNHYKALGRFQPWEIIEALQLDFFEGSVLKYLLRWRRKNGVEDLRKAIHVLERMIEQQEGKKNDAE